MKKRELKHPPYKYFEAYQILANITDEELEKALGLKRRTIKDKINGYYDFTPPEGEVISRLFNQPLDKIFCT